MYFISLPIHRGTRDHYFIKLHVYCYAIIMPIVPPKTLFLSILEDFRMLILLSPLVKTSYYISVSELNETVSGAVVQLSYLRIHSLP